METFYATGLLFFVWPVVALTLLADYVWVALCFALSLMIAGVQEKWAAFKSRFFAVFVASFGVDALLAALLLVLLMLTQANVTVAAWLEHPFVGLGGTLAALGCMLAVVLFGTLKWALYRNIVLKRIKGLERRQVQKASAVLAAFTTPWLFLLPTATASAWLGTVLMAVGKLAGSAALESIGGLATPIP